MCYEMIMVVTLTSNKHTQTSNESSARFAVNTELNYKQSSSCCIFVRFNMNMWTQTCMHATICWTQRNKSLMHCSTRPTRRCQKEIESLGPTLCDIRNTVSLTERHEYPSLEPLGYHLLPDRLRNPPVKARAEAPIHP